MTITPRRSVGPYGAVCDTERCPFHRPLPGGETVATFNVMAKDATGTETSICINVRPDGP